MRVTIALALALFSWSANRKWKPLTPEQREDFSAVSPDARATRLDSLGGSIFYRMEVDEPSATALEEGISSFMGQLVVMDTDPGGRTFLDAYWLREGTVGSTRVYLDFDGST